MLPGRRGGLPVLFFPGNQGSYSVPITLEVSRKIYANKNVTPTWKLDFWAQKGMTEA